MNSNSKPECENSRRNFMQKLGTLAAASSVAASAQQPPQAGAAAQGRGGRGPRPNPAVREPGPLAKQPMPTVKFGKYDISRLIMGVNAPGEHFSVKETMESRVYLTPEKILEENRHMEELGINCMEAGMRRMGQYAKEHDGKILWATRNRRLWTKSHQAWAGRQGDRPDPGVLRHSPLAAPAIPARMPGGEGASSAGCASSARMCGIRACCAPSPVTGRKCSWKSNPRAGRRWITT